MHFTVWRINPKILVNTKVFRWIAFIEHNILINRKNDIQKELVFTKKMMKYDR